MATQQQQEPTTPEVTPAQEPQQEPEKVTLSKEEFDTMQKRIQDNRTAFLKANQSLKEQELLNESLNSKLIELNSSTDLSPDEKERLDELKFSDPDQWYKEMTALNTRKSAELEESLAKVREEAQNKAIKYSNEELLNSFAKDNPDMDLNNVPYSMRLSYDRGDISLDEFLGQVKGFYTKPEPQTKEPETNNQPNITRLGGNSQPSEEAKNNHSFEDYETTTF